MQLKAKGESTYIGGFATYKPKCISHKYPTKQDAMNLQEF
jgi:hypothetical protein